MSQLFASGGQSIGASITMKKALSSWNFYILHSWLRSSPGSFRPTLHPWSRPPPRLCAAVTCLLLLSIFPSIRVFSNESALCIRWPKYWSYSFNISPSSEHPGLISFRMDWLDLLAVQGTLKSLSNTTVQKHQFFGAQPSL